MATILEELNAAARQLKEIYQPIFGHAILGVQPTRICVDRLPDIKKIYDALSKELNRPLRVLDLGCNLGFFSFHAAKWGGVVTGVDIDENNIRFCKILARENPDYKINFVMAKLEEFIPTIKEGEYDLVFCFSVLHWVTQQYGFQFVQNMLVDLSKKIPNGLFELAQRSEFPQNNLPASYRDFLKGYAFIRALSYPTLGKARNFKRPFLFASNEYVHFDDLGLMKIESASAPSYAPDLIKYYCGDKFVKCCYITYKFIEERTQREIQFLKKLSGQNGLPKFYTVLTENDEAGTRVFIVREKIEGVTLSAKLNSDKNIDRWNILKQVLQWLIFLAKNGYYQSDLHAGNFIYSDDGKICPIDYELMVDEPVSIRWPHNIRIAFFDFANSILEPKLNQSKIIPYVTPAKRMDYYTAGRMLTAFRKHISEYQYRQILELKDSADFFEKLYEILFPSEKKELHTMAELEILEIEKYLDELGRNMQAHREALTALNQFIMVQQQRIDQLEKIIREKLK